MSDTGTTSAITHYDPFGTARPGSTLATGIGYAGEWRDPTGLVNLRARAYDPTLARFIGRDTYGGVLSAPQSANRYSYAQNNPYRYTDPSGHFVQTVVEHPGEVASLLVQLTPPGIAYSVLTVVTGWDVLAGRALSDDERSLGLLLIVGGSAALVIAQVAGAAFRALARAGAKLNRGVDRLDGAFGSLAGRLRGAGEGLGAKVRGGASRADRGELNLGAIDDAVTTIRRRLGLSDSTASREAATAGHQASLGSSSTANFRETFFQANPTLRDQVWVHHAVEQQAITRYPGVVSVSEIHSLENLRGVPTGINSQVHLSMIRRMWNNFYRSHETATLDELLDFASEIDRMMGDLFTPPVP